jgi:hypothetical protein
VVIEKASGPATVSVNKSRADDLLASNRCAANLNVLRIQVAHVSRRHRMAPRLAALIAFHAFGHWRGA